MLKRIGIYLNEMFPLSAVIGSIITAMAVQLTYLRLFDIRPSEYWPLVVPAIAMTCVSLLIRIMDEFKDYQDDLKNFPNRPLPSGRVLKNDLMALGIFCVMTVIFLSLTSMDLLIWALVTLFFTFLMLKWFFIEAIMRKNLPLAFITHHPVVVFNFVYLLIACIQMDKAVNFSKALLVLPICLIFTNWEVMRKIRSPEEETAYTTYSKLFGPRVSTLVALVLQVVFILTVLNLFQLLSAPPILWGVFLVAEALLLLPVIHFLIKLDSSKLLKPLAEAQILLVVITLLTNAIL